MYSRGQVQADEYRVKGEKAVLFGSLIVCIIVVFFVICVSLGVAALVVIGSVFWVKLQQGTFLGDCVKVSSNQLPEIYNLASIAAERLSVPLPDVFVKQDPTINAFAIGFLTKKSIVIHTATIEAMTKEELVAIIGHELSHIKCGHTSWLVITGSAQNMLKIPVISDLLGMIFLFWSRKAEYTCDRGGLIANGHLKSTVTAMAKLAIGKSLFDQLNLQSLFDQKKNIDDDLLSKLGQSMGSHPYLVNRIHALRDFYQTTTYNQLTSRMGYSLFVHGKEVQLVPGTKFSLFSGIGAEVIRNPQDPNVMGLKNLSNKDWQTTMPDGSSNTVPPGRSVRLAYNVKINFGMGIGEVR